MRYLVKRIFQDLDRDDISWEQESVAFEFLAIACLAQAATVNGWKVKCSSLPAGIRIDNWCRFPAHAFGRFGRRTRRCEVEELAGALTPRLIFDGPSGEVISIYYQGFPPKDVLGERPDWLLIPAKTTIECSKNKVVLSLNGIRGKWMGQFGTLLGPYGPVERSESGTLTLPCGIIEVSLSKASQHLNEQVSRYKEIYGDIKYVGFLACEVAEVEFPVVTVPDLSHNTCINAGMELFSLLMEQVSPKNL